MPEFFNQALDIKEASLKKHAIEGGTHNTYYLYMSTHTIIQEEHVYWHIRSCEKRPNTSIKSMFLLLVPLNFEPIKTSSQIIAYHSQLSHGKVPDHIHGTSTGFFPHRTNQAAKALRFGGLKKNSRTTLMAFDFLVWKILWAVGKRGDDRGLQTVFCLEVLFFCWAF